MIGGALDAPSFPFLVTMRLPYMPSVTMSEMQKIY